VRLKQRKGDSGYYLQGPLFGGGSMVTYQISPEGFRYLGEHGISLGDRVPSRLIEELKHREDIWTGGGGVSGGGPDQSPVLTIEAIARLGAWALEGSDDEIENLLRGLGLPPNCWFLPVCLNWLADLEGGIRLSELADVSRRDLADACQLRLGSAPTFYRDILSHEGGDAVVWRLTSMIGRVAIAAEHAPECPQQWVGRISERLFRGIKDFLAGWDKQRRGTPRFRYEPPRLCWRVDRQEVVWYLPEQRLPSGMTVSWKVGSDQFEDIRVQHPEGFCVVGVKYSPPLEAPYGSSSEDMAEPAYLSCLVRYESNHSPSVERRLRAELPRGAAILFTEQGEWIAADASDNLLPGEYLALFPPDFPFSDHTEGMEVVDDSLMEPVGWWDWQPRRIRIKPGFNIGAYHCDTQPFMVWHLEGIPLDSVRFSEPCPPVYAGHLPSVVVKASDGASLDEAFATVRHEDSTKKPILIHLSGASSSLEGLKTLDLDACTALQDLYGRFTLRLFTTQRGMSVCKPLTFIRLPNLKLSYTPAPDTPNHAFAVLVSGDNVSVAPQENSTVVKQARREEDGGPYFLVAASNPFFSPEVDMEIRRVGSAYPVTLSVRTPVTRVCIHDRGRTLGGWMKPPVEIDLSQVQHEARLRVQFHVPPELADGELCCRLLSGTLIVSGEPARHSDTFEIRLSRWRDTLGSYARGEVHVRCKERWLPLAILTGTEPPKHARAGNLPVVLAGIDDAILAADWEEVKALAKKAILRAERPSCAAPHADMLHLKAARAWVLTGCFRRAGHCLAVFCEREDIPEVFLVHTQMVLRRDASDSRLLTRLDDDIRQWPESAHMSLAQAECWYRMTRLPRTGAAALQGARDSVRKVDSLDDVDRIQASALALMIAFVAGTDVPCLELPNSELAMQVQRIAAVVEACREYVMTPLGQWRIDNVAALSLDEPLAGIYDHHDMKCLRACITQAQKNFAESATLLEQIPENANIHPLGLLRARQARLEGRIEEAKKLYPSILHKYPVVLDEFP